jgi:hypothetical protein
MIDAGRLIFDGKAWNLGLAARVEAFDENNQRAGAEHP